MFKKFLKAFIEFWNYHVEDHSTTLDILKEGNEQFTSYILHSAPVSNIERVRQMAIHGQNPQAVIVTCSDARISPERIFNAEMGDFFIIRTAGHVVGALEMGSIEYAVTHSSVDIVIVMGHENCGAVKSCIEDHDGAELGYIKDILHEVQPSIDRAEQETDNKFDLLERAEDLNVYHTVDKIKSSSILKPYIESGKLIVVGAKYGIATGKVTFFDDTIVCPLNYNKES